ncbi:MAG: hypothetical protein ACI8TP_003273 [Acidimicrobiales bacterium]|jgi:hypothetical protein
MRKGLAGLILGLSLIVASVSWSGFVMTRTVLDPSRSERLADQMLDNEVLRSALVGRLSDALGAALPADVPVPRQQLEQAANAALEDERVEKLVRDGIVRVHQNALEGNNEPITIDAAALGAASRASLIEVRPELAAVLPEAPAVEIDLPTGGLSWLGSVRRTVNRFTAVLGLIAAAGALSALLITKDRPGVLRRVSIWAFGAAAFWMVVGYGIPFLAKTLAPSSSAIIAAIVDVFFGAMIPPAIMMAVFGAALLGLSLLWSTMAARQPATLLQPAGPGGRGHNPSTGAEARPEPRRGGHTSNVRTATPTQVSRAAHEAPAPVDPTEVFAAHSPDPGDNWDAVAPLPEEPATPTWVEGVGYVKADPADSGPVNSGPVDSEPADFGPVDFGPVDFGPVDFGPVDFGPVDFGPGDSGPVDFGPGDSQRAPDPGNDVS